MISLGHARSTEIKHGIANAQRCVFQNERDISLFRMCKTLTMNKRFTGYDSILLLQNDNDTEISLKNGNEPLCNVTLLHVTLCRSESFSVP